MVEVATRVDDALRFAEARSGTSTAGVDREEEDDLAAHLRGDAPSDRSGATRNRGCIERSGPRSTWVRQRDFFVGSDDGGAVNALFTSLLASCRLCDVEPWTYLRDILCLLPRWPEHRLLDLAPVAWNKARQRDDVQSLLEQNQFRKLTLDSRN